MAVTFRDLAKYLISFLVGAFLMLYIVDLIRGNSQHEDLQIQYDDEDMYQRAMVAKKHVEHEMWDEDVLEQQEQHQMELEQQQEQRQMELEHQKEHTIQQSYQNLPDTYRLSYANKDRVGDSLQKSVESLKKLKNSPRFAQSAIDWSDPSKDLVFVLGSSSNHFRESQDAIAGVQELMPGHTIYYYDIGLNEDQVEEIKSWCSVKYRKLEFSKYPSHVSKLLTYAFKPMIIQNLLQDHYNIIWMDASFRLAVDDLLPVYHMADKNDGVVLFKNSANYITASTNPKLYKFIPTHMPGLNKVKMAGANAIFIRNTEAVYSSVLYWWFLCALDNECIAPSGSRPGCKRANPNHPAIYLGGGCHRFDQSTLNVLLSNYHQYNRTKYTTTDPTDGRNPYISIVRAPTHKHELKIC